MALPDKKQINEVRKTGFRPTVIFCLLNHKSALMFHKKEYALWMFPQGGIRNNETCEEAIMREAAEELGEQIKSKIKPDVIYYLGEDKVEFLPEKYNLEELKTDEGEQIKMIGKSYYIYALELTDPDLDISSTEYDDYHLFEYAPGNFIASKISQAGKRRVSTKVFELLKKADLIR